MEKTNCDMNQELQRLKKQLRCVLLVALILTVLVSNGIYFFLCHMHRNYPDSFFAFFVSLSALFIVCMGMNLLANSNAYGQKCPHKSDYILGAFSLMTDIGIAILFYTPMHRALTLPEYEPVIFGYELDACGWVLDPIFYVAFLIQLLLFLYYHFRSYKGKCNTSMFSCVALTGIFLISAYRTMIQILPSLRYFFWVFPMVNFLCISFGVLGLGINFLLKRRSKKRNCY